MLTISGEKTKKKTGEKTRKKTKNWKNTQKQKKRKKNGNSRLTRTLYNIIIIRAKRVYKWVLYSRFSRFHAGGTFRRTRYGRLFLRILTKPTIRRASNRYTKLFSSIFIPPCSLSLCLSHDLSLWHRINRRFPQTVKRPGNAEKSRFRRYTESSQMGLVGWMVVVVALLLKSTPVFTPSFN